MVFLNNMLFQFELLDEEPNVLVEEVTYLRSLTSLTERGRCDCRSFPI
jgi:hypothetical protein